MPVVKSQYTWMIFFRKNAYLYTNFVSNSFLAVILAFDILFHSPDIFCDTFFRDPPLFPQPGVSMIFKCLDHIREETEIDAEPAKHTA